jgi:glycerol dehydrogenase-like iron-containing ADH family enzyme
MRYLGRNTPLPVSADAVQDLIAQLGLPQHIAEYGIGEPELKEAATELAGKYPDEDLLRIYLAAL